MNPDLSTPVARLALVTPIAMKYGLQPSLVCAVCEQETGGTWDPFTSRNEDDFFRKYISDHSDDKGNPVYKVVIPSDLIRSRSTEARQRAMSWGLMQVMGQTARELGFEARYLNGLCDPETGVLYGCKKLQRCYLQHKDDTTSLLAYNGGSNHNYAAEVLARVAHYTNI